MLPNMSQMQFSVNVSEMLEVRQGYNSDGLHRASKKYSFQEAAPVGVDILAINVLATRSLRV